MNNIVKICVYLKTSINKFLFDDLTTGIYERTELSKGDNGCVNPIKENFSSDKFSPDYFVGNSISTLRITFVSTFFRITLALMLCRLARE